MSLRSFETPSRALVDLSHGEGWMPLHDEVLVNCKMDSTTENQGTGI